MGSLQVLRADGGGWNVGISLAGLRGLAVLRYVLAPCRYVVSSGAGGRAGVINWAVLGGESGTDSGLRVWVSRPVRDRRRWRGAAAAACRRARGGREVLAVQAAALLRMVLPRVRRNVEDLMLYGLELVLGGFLDD